MTTTSPSRRGSNQSITHSALIRLCQDYLEACGAWQLKVLGGLGMRAGCGDLLCALPPSGRLCMVEAKTGTGRLSVKQQQERDAVVAAGGVFVLVRSVDDLEDVLIAEGLVGRRVRLSDRRIEAREG